MATLMANRAKGDLPSTTEVIPKENCKSITLRSGTNYEGPSTEKNEEVRIQDQQPRDQPQAAEESDKGKTTEGIEEKRELPKRKD